MSGLMVFSSGLNLTHLKAVAELRYGGETNANGLPAGTKRSMFPCRDLHILLARNWVLGDLFL
jgi:hypothetical protein